MSEKNQLFHWLNCYKQEARMRLQADGFTSVFLLVMLFHKRNTSSIQMTFRPVPGNMPNAKNTYPARQKIALWVCSHGAILHAFQPDKEFI